jgi:hypothetical protein
LLDLVAPQDTVRNINPEIVIVFTSVRYKLKKDDAYPIMKHPFVIIIIEKNINNGTLAPAGKNIRKISGKPCFGKCPSDFVMVTRSIIPITALIMIAIMLPLNRSSNKRLYNIRPEIVIPSHHNI